MNTLLLALLAAALTASGACERYRGRGAAERCRVEIAGDTFSLEIAADEAARARGLSGRTAIAPGEGMIFVFPRAGLQSFWMHDCLVDIDIMFLDPQGRVTAAHRMKAEPPRAPGESQAAYEGRLKRYPSRLAAQFAIELSAGSLDRLGVRPDDKVSLDAARLKALAR
jgi:hypothetical protein